MVKTRDVGFPRNCFEVNRTFDIAYLAMLGYLFGSNFKL